MFDIGLGTTLAVFGVFVALPEMEIEWDWSAMLAPFFLLGSGYFRQYYVLVEESNRRQRDLYNSLFLIVPSGIGMFGVAFSSEALFGLSLFFGLGTSIVGGSLLVMEVIRWLRGERGYIRDIVTALMMICLIWVPMLAHFAALASFPP